MEGRDRPYDPNNVCCNSPCPPGAFCNTQCCDKKTEFWVQKWTCVWTQTPLQCGDGVAPACSDAACAWTKAWRCRFLQVERCEVLKAFRCRQPARCPDSKNYSGDSDCFVPSDTYFAKVWEIEYDECPERCSLLSPGAPGYDPCKPQDIYGNPGGCACCGLYEVCAHRWVKIACKEQIPPAHPYEVPLPYYERPAAQRRCGARAPSACAGPTCSVGPNGSKSPDSWLSPSLPFA